MGPTLTTTPTPASRRGGSETSRDPETLGIGKQEEVMTTTQLGVAVGVALGFAGAFGGFVAFIIVLVLAAAGYVAGRVLESELDFDAIFGRRNRS